MSSDFDRFEESVRRGGREWEDGFDLDALARLEGDERARAEAILIEAVRIRADSRAVGALASLDTASARTAVRAALDSTNGAESAARDEGRFVVEVAPVLPSSASAGDRMSPESSRPTGGNKRSQPESFRARSLQASLTVKDLRQSMGWYRDVLGFFVGQQFERDGKLMAVELKAGSVQILLTQDDGVRGLDRTKGDGFSLQITTAQDVDELAKRIKERGATLASEPADVFGARAFRLVDLDGFKLTISSER